MPSENKGVNKSRGAGVNQKVPWQSLNRTNRRFHRAMAPFFIPDLHNDLADMLAGCHEPEGGLYFILLEGTVGERSDGTALNAG